jgi:hypothetical protein
MSNTDRINYSIQKQNTETTPKRAEFTATRSVEVITNPNEYEAQVKAFRIETNNILLDEITTLPNDVIACSLTGGAVSNYVSQALAPTKITTPFDYVTPFNNAITTIMTNIRSVNPTFTGGILNQNPFISYEPSTEKFILHIPDYTAPFELIFTLSPSVNNSINLYTSYTPTASLSTDEQNYKVIQSKDQTIVINTFTYYFYKSKGTISGFSQIDSIIIQTSQIPVAPTFEGETNDTKNIILKVFKPTVTELLNNEIVVNYTTDNYFSLNSHYPVKSVDIQFIIRYKDGLEVPLQIYPSNSFSCEIEFKRLDRF